MKTKKPRSAGLEIVSAPKASKSTTPSSRKGLQRSRKGSAVSRSGSRTHLAILRRLDIDPKEVALVPREPAEILTRCLGGKSDRLPREKILSFAAVSNDPSAVAFINALRTVPKLDLARLSFEAMCVRARVSPVAVMGAVVVAAKSMKATESALKAILAHPDVVQATVDAATEGVPVLINGKPVFDENGKVLRSDHGDVAAQRIMHEAVGFLPTKKGGGVEINFGFGRPPEDRDEDSDADEMWDEAFPPLGDEIKSWSADKHKMLEGGK